MWKMRLFGIYFAVLFGVFFMTYDLAMRMLAYKPDVHRKTDRYVTIIIASLQRTLLVQIIPSVIFIGARCISER